MRQKINWIVISIAVVVICLFQVRSCHQSNVNQSQLQELQDYKDTVMFFNTKSGRQLAYNNALKVDFDNYKLLASDSIKQLLNDLDMKKPEYITTIREVIRIDSIPSVALDIPNCNFDTTFQIINPFYQINGNISNKLLSLKSISIPNTTTIVVGDRKSKWFKKREYIVSVTNSNPNVKTEGIQSYSFHEKESRFSIGPSIGYGIYYDPVKSTIGHGFTGSISINYKLIGWKKK